VVSLAQPPAGSSWACRPATDLTAPKGPVRIKPRTIWARRPGGPLHFRV
jgi:hypothetical protein